jgi:hypothetical protein
MAPFCSIEDANIIEKFLLQNILSQFLKNLKQDKSLTVLLF